MDRTRELDADVANMDRQEFFERQDNGLDLESPEELCPLCGYPVGELPADTPHEAETLSDPDLG